MRKFNPKRMAAIVALMAVLGLMAAMPVMAEGDAVTGAVNSFLALGALTLIVIGVILYAVPKIFTDLGVTWKKVFTFSAVICLIAGIFSGIGVGLELDGDDELPPSTPAAWAATLTDNRTNIVWIDQYTANWDVTYNSTTNVFSTATATSATALFTLNTGRTDTSANYYYGVAQVTDIGQFTDPTTGISYNAIAKGTDQLYQADWITDAGTSFNMMCSLPTGETRSGSANVTIELNPAAFDGMIVGQGASFKIVFEGFTWTINCRLAAITAAA